MKSLDSVISEKISQSPEFAAELESAMTETRFALSVARLRESRKLTQGELGAAIKLSQSRIAQIEKGNHSPSIATIAKLGSALGARFIIEPDGSVRFQKIKKSKATSKDNHHSSTSA